MNPLSSLLNTAVLLITAFMAFVSAKNPNRYSTALNRLQNVYHPLFILAEPYLYMPISFAFANYFLMQYNQIYIDFSLCIDPSFRYLMVRFSSDIKKHSDKEMWETWMEICKLLDCEYDKLCKITYFPLRSKAYRIQNKQSLSFTKRILNYITFNFFNSLAIAAIIIFILNTIVDLIRQLI